MHVRGRAVARILSEKVTLFLLCGTQPVSLIIIYKNHESHAKPRVTKNSRLTAADPHASTSRTLSGDDMTHLEEVPQNQQERRTRAEHTSAVKSRVSAHLPRAPPPYSSETGRSGPLDDLLFGSLPCYSVCRSTLTDFTAPIRAHKHR